MSSRVRLQISICLLWTTGGGAENFARPMQSPAVILDPSELSKREDLLGREVIVDDRLRYFQFHPGEGYDEILLRRTPVIFRIPRSLRPPSSPGNPAIQIRGILKRDGEQLACDVTSFQLYPTDLDRLNQAMARLAAGDFLNRKAWSAWAMERAKAFDDKPLREKALSVEAEALRIEGDSLQAAGKPGHWIKLAEDARRRHIPEPEPSALAHRAFRAMLGTSSSSQEVNAVLTSIEGFFPKSKEHGVVAPSEQQAWIDDYMKDPGGGYRRAPAKGRPLLDRMLWVDAVAKRLRVVAKEDPRSGLSLATQALSQIPERPALVEELSELGIDSATKNVGSFRIADVQEAARTIGETFHKPDKSKELLQEWLKNQRAKVSDTDADGLLTLANRYEELINDRQSALEIIRRAWKADPGSKEVEQAFRIRGLRKAGDDWVQDGSQRLSVVDGTDGSLKPQAVSTKGQTGLRGLNPDQVRQKLGNKPDRIVYCGTKGRLVEQWIYFHPRLTQYVNFIHTPNELKPKVISDYSLDRIPRPGLPGRPQPASSL